VGGVPFPRRREDPLPQTPYVALDPLPVDQQPRQGLALRSVHPRRGRGVQLVLRFPRRRHRVLSPAHLTHMGALSGRGTRPRIRPVPRRQPLGGAARCLPFLSPFGAPALASWVILRPLGLCASLTVGLPSPPRTPSGLPRCPRARSDRDGCPLYSGDAVPTRPAQASRPSLAASQRPTPVPRCCFHLPRAWDNGASSRVHSRSPVRSSPLPVTPGGTGALGRLLRASHPAVTGDACRSGDGHSGTCPESRHRHQPALPNASTRRADPCVARLPCHHP
jgi:hypothetical protein